MIPDLCNARCVPPRFWTAAVASTLAFACGRSPEPVVTRTTATTPRTTSTADAGAGSAPLTRPAVITTAGTHFEHHEWWGRSVFVPPNGPVPRPSLRTAYLRCVAVYDPRANEDRTSGDTFRPSLKCQASKPAALATPVPPALASWLALAFVLSDGPVDNRLARAYERAYDPKRVSELERPKDPFPTGTLVYVETEVRHRVRETRPFVCPPVSDHPCDPPGPDYTGREWTKVDHVELVARLGGRNTGVWITNLPLQWDSVAPLLTLLGGGMRELPAVLLVMQLSPGSPPLSLATPHDARATRAYLEQATATDIDTRLALAFDRASVAIYWRDTGALATAMRALDVELAARHGAPLPAVFVTVFAKYLDTYRELADGRLALAAPLGLEPLVRYYFE